MDSLALLCNLHGDGPATLAGLRELDCFELFEVLALTPGSLVQLFDGNERIAKRFAREAVFLADRLGELPAAREVPVETQRFALEPMDDVSPGPDVEEFTPWPGDTEPELLTPFPALSKGGPESAAALGIEPLPAPELPKETSAFQAEVANGPVVKAVLELWSRLDSRETQPASPPSFGLVEAGLEGLTDELAQTLTDAGIQSLSDLLEANVLDLSSATNIPYTKLAHLQFLGRKQLSPEQRGELTPYDRLGELVPEQPVPRAARASSAPVTSESKAAPIPEPLGEDGPAGPFA